MGPELEVAALFHLNLAALAMSTSRRQPIRMPRLLVLMNIGEVEVDHSRMMITRGRVTVSSVIPLFASSIREVVMPRPWLSWRFHRLWLSLMHSIQGAVVNVECYFDHFRPW